jgi:thermitase
MPPRTIINLSAACIAFALFISAVGSTATTLRWSPETHASTHILVKYKPKKANRVVPLSHHSSSAGVTKVTVAENETVADTVNRMQAHPDVLFAEPDYIAKTLVTPNDPLYPRQWGPPAEGADLAWTVSTGSSSIKVCVLDTGVDYTHNDLKANVPTIGWNAITNTSGGLDTDNPGHGTHCAGIMGAVGNNSLGVCGVNWNLDIVPCKFMSNGQGTYSDAITCLYYCQNAGAKIFSMSWGGPYSSILNSTLTEIGAQGVLFVAAAGNTGSNNDLGPKKSETTYPASFKLPSVISVAATNRDDTLSTYSNYGPNSVHIAAPGNHIISTFPGNQYGYLSGTSMATPLVSGTLALMQAAAGGKLSASDLKSMLLSSATAVAPLAGYVQGARRLNISAAIAAASGKTISYPTSNSPTTQPPSPVPSQSSPPLLPTPSPSSTPIKSPSPTLSPMVVTFDLSMTSTKRLGIGYRMQRYICKSLTASTRYNSKMMECKISAATQLSSTSGSFSGVFYFFAFDARQERSAIFHAARLVRALRSEHYIRRMFRKLGPSVTISINSVVLA